MSVKGQWNTWEPSAPSLQMLANELEPGQRLAVDAMIDAERKVMVGGIYRDDYGTWFVYTEDVTDCSRDAVSAYAEFGEASRPFWELDWVVTVEDYR